MANLKKQGVPFTQIANEVLNDKNMSFRAKGLFSYLFSKPDGWDFSYRRIVLDSKDGDQSVLSGLKELEKNGYLTRIKLSTGKIEYHLKYYNTQAPKTPKPKLGFPQAGENATISNKEEENKKEVFLSESADSESFSVKADEKKSDVLMQNEAKLKKLISDGEFSKEKYRFPENGPFDWRYLVNNGKGLSVAKLIVAIYWREKSLDKYPGKKYSYATKGLASGVMMQEMKYAKELASMIDFWDVKKLVEVVDGKFESMFKNKPYEWKVKNLCNYAYLLNEPDGQEQ